MAKNKQKKCFSKKSEDKVKSVKGGSVGKKSDQKVVSYIHVGDAGKEDLEKYMTGKSNLTLQIYQEERLPDIDENCMINGLDQLGTSADFSDEHHRCSRACPVGCQGHLRPNEGSLQAPTKQKKPKVALVPPVLPNDSIGVDIPEKYQLIIDARDHYIHNDQIQKDYGWNPLDKSDNLAMRSQEDRCVRRQPVTQSTDGVRGKMGVSRGISIYEISWPVRMRGTHASVGVATRQAPIQAHGYIPLIGSNRHSWGWDIGRKEVIHHMTRINYPSAGTLSFAGDGKWYGPAFSGLEGETVFPAVSTVWGHAEVLIKYIGTNRR